VPVSGLEGATFLTADMASIRRFYGKGAGFAEAPSGPLGTRFIVGNGQWIEFLAVADPDWQRRLQHVTFSASSLEEVERSLAARGVPAQWMDSALRTRVLQFQDPAGNLIQVAAPWVPPATPAASGFSDHLQHIGFAVPRAQAEAEISFYRDRLGWPEVTRMAGPEGRTALVKFRLPGPGRELLELIFFDPPLNKWAAGAFDHVNFEVRDIDAAYQALRRGGIANQDKDRPVVNGERFWAINLFDPELTRVEIQVLEPAGAPIGTVSTVGAAAARPLFDGATLAGWEGNTGNWRVEDGAIVAGALGRTQPFNEFLATTEDFGDFDLRLQYKVEGTGGFVNGGVQFWSQRVPASHEVSGFQADLGAGTDGNLYDESRRSRNLMAAPDDVRKRALRPGAWNDYRIRAEGAHIEIWLNGIMTVDYTERDPAIALRGKFALQIHGGANTKVSYRRLEWRPTKEQTPNPEAEAPK
jgi:catechol 2,3-dioxygenase-like lactoylglutathione lyase family enzyme